MPARVYTIGHSTRSADEFLALLSARLSDAFDIRGVDVFHIESRKPPRRHQRTEFARELNVRPVYPGLL